MCGSIASGTAAGLATALPTAAAADAALGGGGGSTAPASIDLASVVHGLADALTALTTTLAKMTGAAGAVDAATGAALPTMNVTGGGDPGSVGQSPIQAAMPPMKRDGGAHAGGHKRIRGVHHGNHAKHHGIHELPRSAPEDRQRAQTILNAVTDVFGNADRSRFHVEKFHAGLPKELRAEFHRRYPDLPVPHGIVFDKGPKPVAVVYRDSTSPNFDLGIGAGHQHSATGPRMQHVWLTPGNLDQAYSDVSAGARVKANRAING